MPYSAVSDLGMHCLAMSHKKDARLYGLTSSDGDLGWPVVCDCVISWSYSLTF